VAVRSARFRNCLSVSMHMDTVSNIPFGMKMAMDFPGPAFPTF
jgi:hypothetical protein